MVKYVFIFILIFGLGIRTFAQENDFDLGIQAYNEGDYESAFLLFDNWLRENPRDPEGYWYLGQVYEQFDGMSDFLALENYNQALALNSEMTPVYLHRGRLFLRLKRFEEAEADFITYRRLPKGETTRIIYKTSGTDSGVSSIFTDQSENPSQILYLLSLSKAGQGQVETAISLLDSAIYYSPLESDFYAEKGKLLMDEKQDQAALIALEKALQINPDHYLAKQRVLSIRQGGDREKLEELTKAISTDPENPLPWKIRGYYKFSQSDFKGALSDFSEAISLHPEDAENWFYRAKTYAKLKNWMKAEQDFTEAMFLTEQEPELLLGRGQARYYQNKTELALADFIQLISIDPSNASGYYHRGITLHRLNRASEACNDLTKAVQLGMENIGEVKQKICN